MKIFFQVFFVGFLLYAPAAQGQTQFSGVRVSEFITYAVTPTHGGVVAVAMGPPPSFTSMLLVEKKGWEAVTIPGGDFFYSIVSNGDLAFARGKSQIFSFDGVRGFFLGGVPATTNPTTPVGFCDGVLYVVTGDTATEIGAFRLQGESLQKIPLPFPRGKLGNFIASVSGWGETLLLASGEREDSPHALHIWRGGELVSFFDQSSAAALRSPNSFCADGRGTIWVAGGFFGLARVDSTGKLESRVAGGPDKFAVKGVYPLASRRVLLLTSPGTTWRVFNPPTGLIETLGSLGPSSVNQFCVSRGKLYVAGHEGLYVFTVPGEDTTGVVEPPAPEDSTGVSPQGYALRQNYPNPFNPGTRIRFDMPQAGQVLIQVFDITSQEVAVLVNTNISAGQHTVYWNASGFASGIYFYRLRVGKDFISTRKALLIR